MWLQLQNYIIIMLVLYESFCTDGQTMILRPGWTLIDAGPPLQVYMAPSKQNYAGTVGELFSTIENADWNIKRTFCLGGSQVRY